ncbi:PaRep2b protein [Pyrobaculum aerophilum]|uniref:PaRep2b protein n=1 Tax=Pyrobaculum aerophilum TaxID=13773 RepID=UPI002FD9B937
MIDVRVAQENGRPRVIVEYEVNGVVRPISLTWYTTSDERVMTTVRLNDERALVLASLLETLSPHSYVTLNAVFLGVFQ